MVVNNKIESTEATQDLNKTADVEDDAEDVEEDATVEAGATGKPQFYRVGSF